MPDMLLSPSGVEAAAFESQFQMAFGQLLNALDFGREIAKEIDRVLCVSCGAGHWHGMNLKWFADTITTTTEFQTKSSADLIALDLPKLNDVRTLVVLSSKSGSTKETLEAAAFLQAKACRKIVFTKSADAALAKYGERVFVTGDTTQAFHAAFMLMQAFVAGFWETKDSWPHAAKLLSSFRAFPAALLATAKMYDERGAVMAANYDGPSAPIYIIGSGPGKLVQNAFGLCVVEEMIKVPVRPVDADQFFHSTLEIVTKETPGTFIIILGEDTSRKQAERADRFVAAHGPSSVVHNTASDAMEGIDPVVRCFFAPYIAEASFKPFAFYLAKKLGKPLSDLRYMGKIEY